MEMSRRSFLGATAGATMVAGMMTRGTIFGANERVNMCTIGFNGRGGEHIGQWTTSKNANLVALCDVDSRVLERGLKMVEKNTGVKPKGYTDMREAFADKEIDAVSIATPNHWHTLATVWACEAGKDVYVEKPATHNIYEGAQIQAAAKKFDRVVQHGTQRRSENNWMRDIALLQSGEIIGPLYMARGLGYKNGNRGAVPEADDAEAPAYLQWDLWQGPASRRAYNKMYLPYNWHWFWHYGNGEIGNQGIHQLDVAVWGMNKGKLPSKVYSGGGRFTYTDKAESPNTNVATFTYDDGTMLVFEVRNRWTNKEGGREINGKFVQGVDVGNLFYGDTGYYVEGQGFFDTKDEPIPIDNAKYPMPESEGCWENFLAAVKAHDVDGVHGNVRDCHLSSGHAHLANTSYRLGRSLTFDPATELYVGDDEANTHIGREYAAGFEVPKIA